MFIAVNVLALNVWGMPGNLGAEDKELRIAAVGDMIAKAEYDVYLLSGIILTNQNRELTQLLTNQSCG